MPPRIYRPINHPLRDNPTWQERWQGDDQGLITCWETGRQQRVTNPTLAHRASQGELPVLDWKGGIETKTKHPAKHGTLYYLAQWQGLRGEALNIDTHQEITHTCTNTNMEIIYTGDIDKHNKPATPLKKRLTFTALSIATANPDSTSICQIGVVKYIKGELKKEWSSLINPNTFFTPENQHLQDLLKKTEPNNPTLPDIIKPLTALLTNTIIITHSPFPRLSLHRALTKHNLPAPLNTTWLDSSQIARRTWQHLSHKNHTLTHICQHLNHPFNPHHPIEIATATAQIILTATKTTGLDLTSWSKRLQQPITPSPPPPPPQTVKPHKTAPPSRKSNRTKRT